MSLFFAQLPRRDEVLSLQREQDFHSKVTSFITVNNVLAIRNLVKDGAGIQWGPRWISLALKPRIEQRLFTAIMIFVAIGSPCLARIPQFRHKRSEQDLKFLRI